MGQGLKVDHLYRRRSKSLDLSLLLFSFEIPSQSKALICLSVHSVPDRQHETGGAVVRDVANQGRLYS